MKILSLQLSNIVSFKHTPNIEDVSPIPFDENLNIIIGENGSGKSTALEVINFLFKRVLYKQYAFNQDVFNQRATTNVKNRKQLLTQVNANTSSGFRLDPNWNTPTQEQRIRLIIKLDEVDRANINVLLTQLPALKLIFEQFTTRPAPTPLRTFIEQYTIDVVIEPSTRTFTAQLQGASADFGYEYLTEYNFYKEAIGLYNIDTVGSALATLNESFTLISSYRNYHAFNTSVSLSGSAAPQQIQQIRDADFARSLNATDNAEPGIFGLVRLRVADKHFNLLSEKLSPEERETAANDLPFMASINARLAIVNLSCRIRLLVQRTWQYSFEFVDLRRNVTLLDINSLSAGQKAILHLVFEAYGRGELKGGVVVIDEPEIHLHYQFQHEYLQVVRELSREQKCQYLIVTHSEALINSSTIGSVRRFSLAADGSTEFHCPQLSHQQKSLIKILDNTRSTYAFFAKKVVLVEGDSDRYFVRAALQCLYPAVDQQVAILHVGGKTSFPSWSDLFEAFGLTVYRVADFDYCLNLFYPSEPKIALRNTSAITSFKSSHMDVMSRIASEYSNQTYILQNGDLEHYLGVKKDLAEVIAFCEIQLRGYLGSNSSEAVEVKAILHAIAS
jgi:predicted ATPase